MPANPFAQVGAEDGDLVDSPRGASVNRQGRHQIGQLGVTSGPGDGDMETVLSMLVGGRVTLTYPVGQGAEVPAGIADPDPTHIVAENSGTGEIQLERGEFAGCGAQVLTHLIKDAVWFLPEETQGDMPIHARYPWAAAPVALSAVAPAAISGLAKIYWRDHLQSAGQVVAHLLW